MAEALDTSLPTIVYFDFDGGRGEHIRLAFHLGGVAFNDHRISFPEFKVQWKETGKAPYGSLPVLVVGGNHYAQSGAILRYAAKAGNAGLYPADNLDALLVDQLVRSS
jgi:glutathione S-transferase